MTTTLRVLRTFAMALAVALYATAASPQSFGDIWLATVDAEREPQVHDHQEHAYDAAALPGSPGDEMMSGMMSGMRKRHEDAMTRGAAMDDRINTLVADVNMFTGEFKVVVMAALLTAIVQRQSVMRDEMRQMHGEMMGRMMERHESAASPAASLDEESSWGEFLLGGDVHVSVAEAASPDQEPGTLCAPTP